VRAHDVTLPLAPASAGWPGDPPFRLRRFLSLERGDECNASEVAMSAHAGTHVDAPLHFLPGGAAVESLPLDSLVGECLVVEADPPDRLLAPRHLPAEPFQRILFKTSNSARWRAESRPPEADFVALGEPLARRLASLGVRLVGVDGLSVDRAGTQGHPVHRLLLEAGVVIVESLDLAGVGPGRYQLVCLPLKLVGSDGSPARVLLLEG
jgi:arylformamidase